jgi:hypothetical protein
VVKHSVLGSKVHDAKLAAAMNIHWRSQDSDILPKTSRAVPIAMI